MSEAPDFLWTALPAASSHAAEVDHMILAFAGVILLFVAPVFLLITWFVIKYRRGSAADRSNRPAGNSWLEASWAMLPFLAVLGFFVWAARSYLALARPPENALEIVAVGKQWMWKFQHPDGQSEIDILHVPVNQPVRLTMTSEDVIHSLFLPALRIKQDVLPGRYTQLWFEAGRTGTYHLHCAQFCGTEHAVMGGSLVVVTASEYAAWLAAQPQGATLAAQGEALFRRYGCSGCHGPGSTVHAPMLEGLYGAMVPLADGRTVTADERYLHDAIVQPAREVRAGYAPMPSYNGALGEGAVIALVAYVKSLRPEIGWEIKP
jgi:cytochrome c oxidase subunit 2